MLSSIQAYPTQSTVIHGEHGYQKQNEGYQTNCCSRTYKYKLCLMNTCTKITLPDTVSAATLQNKGKKLPVRSAKSRVQGGKSSERQKLLANRISIFFLDKPEGTISFKQLPDQTKKALVPTGYIKSHP